MDEKTFIMTHLLQKMINKDLWGGKHTELRNLKKYLSKDRIGAKVTQEALKELLKKEWILTKMSTQEIHVSLNSRKMKEIEEFIEKEC